MGKIKEYIGEYMLAAEKADPRYEVTDTCLLTLRQGKLMHARAQAIAADLEERHGKPFKAQIGVYRANVKYVRFMPAEEGEDTLQFERAPTPFFDEETIEWKDPHKNFRLRGHSMGGFGLGGIRRLLDTQFGQDYIAYTGEGGRARDHISIGHGPGRKIFLPMEEHNSPSFVGPNSEHIVLVDLPEEKPPENAQGKLGDKIPVETLEGRINRDIILTKDQLRVKGKNPGTEEKGPYADILEKIGKEPKS